MSEPVIQAYGENSLADIELGKKVLDALEHYYPNHAFFVQCNHEAGVVTIQLLYEDKNKLVKRWLHGMLIHITSLQTESEIKLRAMRDGGELLERYNLARSGANPYTYVDAASKEIILDGVMQ